MGALTRSSFARGWVPSADAVHAPADGLLRGDNLQLDERGVLGLRLGSTKINGSAFADVDCHSLFTAVLNGTRYRMTGAAAAVYANGTSIATGTAGSNDIQFGSYLGQILWARSTSKKKYDGTTVRTWGLTAPNAAVTLAAIAADGKTFATCDQADAEFVWTEDDGTLAGYMLGYDSTAAGAAVLRPQNTSTWRGRLTKTFSGATNFNIYDGGQAALDDTDEISLWFYVTEPQFVEFVSFAVDVNAGTFLQDQYVFTWFFLKPNGEITTEEEGGAPQLVVGWNRLAVLKRDMQRSTGGTAGKNWTTVKAIRLTVQEITGGAAALVAFDLVRIYGGSASPLTGIQRYKLVAGYNNGTYTGLSAPSAVSADIEATTQGVTVTVPAGVITALDAQTTVNEMWLYRYSAELGNYYRVAVKTGGPWGGAQTITDTVSNASALTTNIVLNPNITTPPDDIVGIVGPHYDRILCLTATKIHPSQPRNLDSFDTTEEIRVGDASETAYWIAKVQEEIYVGTSKDIYRIQGDWTVRADGLINVVKTPMGVAQPPISAAIAQDGQLLIYLAADGWRAIGAAQPITAGDVDLLYRGYTRHGVSPVNLTGGRFKAAMGKGLFTAITPEGASTTSSATLHRFVPELQRWYRHTYPQAWRCVYREPDGTLIASDGAGFVWTLDTGTQDGSTDIPVVLWTPIEDNGQPNQRKDAWEGRVRANTGGATATVAVHLDGSGSSSTSFTVASSGLTPVSANLSALAVYRQSQLRVTGSFSTFLWYDYTITYRERPAVLVFVEPKPEVRGTRRKRFAGLTVILDTLGGAASVTPMIDGAAQTAVNVTTSDVVSTPVAFANVVGRDLWAKIALSTGFEFYGIDPIVVAEFPPLVRGRLPDTDAGYPFRKRIIGIRIRACTLNAARTFTTYVDNASVDTFAATTAADDPDDLLHYFATQQIGTEIGLSVDGNIEVYGDYAPIVQQQFPQPVLLRVPDTDGGYPFRKRMIGIKIRACTLGAQRTFTPYVDGTALETFTATTDANEPDDIFHYFTTQQIGTDIAYSVDGNIEPYGSAEALIQQQFPQPVLGRIADTNAGTPKPKIMTGIRIRACTLGATRTFTTILDESNYDTWTGITSANESDELVHSFSTPQVATDIAFSVDGNIELVSWEPLIDAVLPIGRKLWDSGPVDFGTRAVWVPGLTLKAKLTGTLTITPYVDDVAQPSVTVGAASGNPITTYDVRFSRVVRGRQVRFRVSSSSTFYLYWLEPRYRVTGSETELKRRRVETAA